MPLNSNKKKLYKSKKLNVLNYQIFDLLACPPQIIKSVFNRGLFRTKPNIYDGLIFAKIVRGFYRKATSQMFGLFYILL